MKTKKVIIYGAGQVGVQIAWNLGAEYKIVCFVDKDKRRQTSDYEIMRGGGGIFIDDKVYPVYAPEKLKSLEFDEIFIGVFYESWANEILQMLHSFNIPKSKIQFKLTWTPFYARLNFIKTLSLQFREQNLKGAVAELGVWRGDTASFINQIFPNDEFYLFDTFEGFDDKDCKVENIKGLSKADKNDFSDTSLEFVKAKMPNLDKCHFVKGYFPQSASDINDNLNFKFVNIDADLYQPILAGCEYFYPRLVNGGLLLIHDYFNHNYTGVKQAVDEFCIKNKLVALPIGDAFSIIITK